MTGSPKAKQIFTICIFLFHFSDCTIADTSLRIGNTHTTHHLTYGEALYNVYQDKYFSAITNLMVEKERSAFTRQNDDSALLLGSLYLSYGLHKSASIIFEKLTRENTEASTYDLAWFYLGKLRYITGDLAGSLSAFTKPENTLPTSIKAERDYYIVNILLNNGNYNEAIDAVERLKGDEIWHRYAFYNLGIALIRTSRDDEGIFHLNKIQTNDTNNEEESALSDKANVAKGYASLRRNHMADSTEYFSHSRLKGTYSNSALLGLGWAYSKQNKVQEALSPWLELSRRKSRDSAYHEVLLAIPQALEKLGAEEAALSHYQNAENIFNESLLELSEAKLSFTKIDNSFQYKAKQNNGNYNLFSINTIEDTKYHKYFSELISSPLFQTAYKKHLELHQLLIHIRDWKNKIPIIKPC